MSNNLNFFTRSWQLFYRRFEMTGEDRLPGQREPGPTGYRWRRIFTMPGGDIVVWQRKRDNNPGPVKLIPVYRNSNMYSNPDLST
jgi:hypothetical protein